MKFKVGQWILTCFINHNVLPKCEILFLLLLLMLKVWLGKNGKRETYFEAEKRVTF